MTSDRIGIENAQALSGDRSQSNLQTFFVWLQRPPNLWLFIFLYILFIGLFIQLILLPHVFPAMHAGNGLLDGLDAIRFHQIAVARSKIIKETGWDQWELLAGGQLVSGIASLFYVLIVPEPWTLLPLNAALHAIASVCIYFILGLITRRSEVSLIATLPFIFFPSNLMWNSQFLNENYAVSGIALLLYGWVVLSIFEKERAKPRLSKNARSIIAIGLGCLLFGLVRIEVFSGLVYLFVFLAVLAGLVSIVVTTDPKTKIVNLAFIIAAIAIMLVSKPFFEKIHRGVNYQRPPSAPSFVPEDWERTAWLPEIMDQQLEDIAKYRSIFVQSWTDAGSNIDENVTFTNAEDLLSYVPRAIQIAFLAPFPRTWFEQGYTPGGTAMRVVSGFEMIVVYFSLLGLPLFLWKFRKQTATWVVFLACGGMLVIYALTIPNVGSLYRFRYPYLMPVVGFGLAGWLNLLLSQKKAEPEMGSGKKRPSAE